MGVPEQCEQACGEIRDTLGPIDILVNNVGNRVEERSDPGRAAVDVAADDRPESHQRGGSDPNHRRCRCCRRAAGRIINIASISGLIANRGIGGRDYETSKAAVIHFTRCAAVDWAPHGITVNAICPGLFMTDVNREWNERRPDVIEAFVGNVPIARPGEPAGIGPLAVYLASPGSAYVTGATFVIDGGYTAWWRAGASPGRHARRHASGRRRLGLHGLQVGIRFPDGLLHVGDQGVDVSGHGGELLERAPSALALRLCFRNSTRYRRGLSTGSMRCSTLSICADQCLGTAARFAEFALALGPQLRSEYLPSSSCHSLKRAFETSRTALT